MVNARYVFCCLPMDNCCFHTTGRIQETGDTVMLNSLHFCNEQTIHGSNCKIIATSTNSLLHMLGGGGNVVMLMDQTAKSLQHQLIHYFMCLGVEEI